MADSWDFKVWRHTRWTPETYIGIARKFTKLTEFNEASLYYTHGGYIHDFQRFYSFNGYTFDRGQITKSHWNLELYKVKFTDFKSVKNCKSYQLGAFAFFL